MAHLRVQWARAAYNLWTGLQQAGVIDALDSSTRTEFWRLLDGFIGECRHIAQATAQAEARLDWQQ